MLSVLLACNGGNPDNQPTANAAITTSNIDQIVDQVNNDFSLINNKQLAIENVKWETVETANCPPGAGEITYHGEAGLEEKVVEKIFGNGSELLTEYYFKNGNVFYIFEESSYYPPDDGPVVKYETKIYVSEGVPVKTMDANREVNGVTEAEHLQDMQRKVDYAKTLLPRKKTEELLQQNCSDYQTE